MHLHAQAVVWCSKAKCSPVMTQQICTASELRQEGSQERQRDSPLTLSKISYDLCFKNRSQKAELCASTSERA